MQSRRQLLEALGLGGVASLLGCAPDRPMALDDSGFLISTPTGTPSCPDPFAEGTFLEAVPFDVAVDRPLGELYGAGWDARRVFDLTRLDAGAMEVSPDQFYVRTEYPDRLTTDPDSWIVRIEGLVNTNVDVPIAEIRARSVDQGILLLECSGNGEGGGFGLMSAARWSGAPLLELIDDLAGRAPSATAVLVEGFDDHSVPSEGGHSVPGASWVFGFDQLQTWPAFLATELGGAPLPPDNGAPVRLLVPGWYGCACIKWVTSIRLVDDSEPATSQMVEFASRIHQSGQPALARDYRAANQELSATAVRVEKWRLEGEIAYRIVGILWGGLEPVSSLRIRAGNVDQPVSCFEHGDPRTWTLWAHVWRPRETGPHNLSLYVDEPRPQTRLDLGWYDRSVTIDEL